ncbi:MAG: GAF domain-containing protein, partial [bacterium]|nr:GAF domain-containing protein [bacterium]
SLMRLQLYDTVSKNEQRKYRKHVRQSIKMMEEWAAIGPMNFSHRLYLMQAELYRVTGKGHKAIEYYEKAITSAREHEFLYVEALACELAAKFYMRNDRDELAEFYFQKTWQCYRKWGAGAKLKHLEANYPKYMRQSTYSDMRNTGTISTSTDSAGSSLDIKSILKASQTLSGEVQLKRLLEKTMQILIENAGAQKGLFIENKAGNLLAQVEGNIDGAPGILNDLPLAESGKAPLSLINFVTRSHEELVLDNASKDTKYASDPYVDQHKTRSVICFPILKKGQLAGIIYLENNRVEGAFTPARVEVLNMLSAQIAISIENAELYENLEEKVRLRTLAIKKANEELAESNRKINDSVNYASRIQQAVLPGKDLMVGLLPNYFSIYKPCSTI